MDLRHEFQKHADECRRMAVATKDLKSKATWNEMAERWAKAAQTQAQVEQQAFALRRTRQPTRRAKVHGWLEAAV